VEVLVDSVDDERGLSGRTRDFRIVHLQGDASLLGKVVTVEVVAAGPNALQGKPVGPPIH
jgi:tRNA A37 methylthiotransferase MiaB